MKHKRKPNVRQCNLIRRVRLNPEDWMVERDTPTEMIVVHRHFDNTRRIIPKGGDEE